MARLRCVAVGLVFGLASATGTVVRRFLTTRMPPRKGDAKEQRQPRDESRVQSACAPKEPTHAKLTRATVQQDEGHDRRGVEGASYGNQGTNTHGK